MSRRILYIGNCLSKHGFTPTTVETLGNSLKETHSVKQVSSAKNPFLRLIDMLWSCLTIKKKNAVAIIDTYSTSAFRFAYFSARLLNIRGIPYITNMHGGNLPNKAKSDNAKVAWLTRNAHRNVCPSGYLKHELEKLCPGDFNIIPNSIEIGAYIFKHRKSVGKNLNLLWVRSFHETYNPLLALDVLTILKSKYEQDCMLTMVGPDKDGSMGKFKTKAQELNISHQIEITGKLSRNEWLTLGSNHDVFINTTNFDNTPVSVIEAMALGLPVVSTDVGGLPYLIEHNTTGLLTNPGDAEAFATEIVRLAEDSNLISKLSKNGRDYAETLDRKPVVANWNTLLDNV